MAMQEGNYCDCERGHNGIGLAGRKCDCAPGGDLQALIETAIPCGEPGDMIDVNRKLIAEHVMQAIQGRAATWALNPDASMPDCPCCYRPLGIRQAWMNTSGRDEWACDDCGRNGVNEHGQ